MKKSVLNIFFGLLILVVASVTCSSRENAMKYRIKEGKFVATVSETGELDAVNSRIITMPYVGWKYGSYFKIIGLKEHGADVAAGDSIAQIDPQNVLKYLMGKKNDLAVEKAALNKLIVEHQSRTKSLQTEISTAKAVLDLNRIQLDKMQFAPERKQKIQELEFKTADIKFKKAQKKYELSQKVMENELIIQKTKLSQMENEIKDSESALSKLKIICPQNGMLQVAENPRNRQMIRVGDELYQSAKLMSVPDLSEMKVKTSVNEADIEKIHLDQPVIIKLDAFPKVSFSGKIIEIGKISYKKDKNDLSKVFDIVVLMEKSDPILKPGMTVRCDIVVADLDDVFYIENDCIFRENLSYYIMISENDRPKRCDITIGPRNYEYTVIYGNFEKGQKIIPACEINAPLPVQASIQ